MSFDQWQVLRRVFHVRIGDDSPIFYTTGRRWSGSFLKTLILKLRFESNRGAPVLCGLGRHVEGETEYVSPETTLDEILQECARALARRSAWMIAGIIFILCGVFYAVYPKDPLEVMFGMLGITGFVGAIAYGIQAFRFKSMIIAYGH